MKKQLVELETILGYSFEDKLLLKQALTHPSKKLESNNAYSYQRLEFLGDKVLNFTIAQHLFKMFPSETEGEISRRHAHLVCGALCSRIAAKLNIFPFIIFSAAQRNDSSLKKDRISEDALEAIIGAIFLDSGLQNAIEFIMQHWQQYIEQNQEPPKDPKSSLQEYMQKRCNAVPFYTTQQQGKIFEASVTVEGLTFTAQGGTKKTAEKCAAKNALAHLVK